MDWYVACDSDVFLHDVLGVCMVENSNSEFPFARRMVFFTHDSASTDARCVDAVYFSHKMKDTVSLKGRRGSAVLYLSYDLAVGRPPVKHAFTLLSSLILAGLAGEVLSPNHKTDSERKVTTDDDWT